MEAPIEGLEHYDPTIFEGIDEDLMLDDSNLRTYASLTVQSENLLQGAPFLLFGMNSMGMYEWEPAPSKSRISALRKNGVVGLQRIVDNFTKNPIKLVGMYTANYGGALGTFDYVLGLEDGLPVIDPQEAWNELPESSVGRDVEQKYVFTSFVRKHKMRGYLHSFPHVAVVQNKDSGEKKWRLMCDQIRLDDLLDISKHDDVQGAIDKEAYPEPLKILEVYSSFTGEHYFVGDRS